MQGKKREIINFGQFWNSDVSGEFLAKSYWNYSK